VIALALAAFLAQESLSSKELAEAKDLATRYFAAKTWDEKAAIAAKLEAIDHPSKGDIGSLTRHCLALIRRGPTVDPRGAVQKCTHPDFPGTFALSAPASAKSRPTGVFIGLHGRGGDGPGAQRAWGGASPDLIGVFPTVPDTAEAAGWNTERAEQFVLAVLEDVKRSFVVDTNRVYLAGHSMGGFGTWSAGTHHADLFAALSSGAGGNLVQNALPNLKNTPIWFYHSKDDNVVKADWDIETAEQLAKLKAKHGPFDYVWKLYDDIGHGMPRDGVKPIVDWMAKKTRSPHPKHVLWEGTRATKRFFFWLKREKPGGSVEAKLDGNTIELAGSTTGLEILLNDRVVKLGEPVVVKVDGQEKHNAKVKHSIVALVESAAARTDEQMIYVARIKVP